jgi:outer membrane receptor protein involved in Fe transport
LTLTFGPWRQTEFFLDWGKGFHSNDARGATIKVDPADGVTPADKVTPLVSAIGEEIGVRTAIVPRVLLSASLWTLKLDSELLFSGDGGTTEPSRASRRTGVELSAYYTPTDDLIIDADLAWSRSRFTDYDVVGDRIPNAVERVASLGITYNRTTGWFGGARLRHLGPAPLIEDNSVRSKAATLVNFDVGYHITRAITGSITLLNVFDEKANDITYYYASQLRGEAQPVNDIHFHPVEPRQVRATLAARF